jgi:putative nucleotidyltransferase with HDIG domain
MVLPTYKEIEALYDKYEMYDNIRKHSRQVAKIATFVTKQLISKGVHLPLEEIEKAALLHDIAKTKCLKEKNGNHNEVGAQIVVDEGFPELAEYVFIHTSTIILEENGVNKWLSQPLKHKLLIFSDAHVNNFTLVSLEERFQYLLGRYLDQSKKLNLAKEALEKFETDLKKTYDLDLDFCKLND